jgi:predicted ester cyclase
MALDIATTVRNTFDTINNKDLATFQKALDPKFQAVFSDAAQRARTAFPDMKLTVDDVITEGDKVVTRWTMTGTHKGTVSQFPLGEVKPTGKPVTVQGITIHQVQNGVIVNSWGVTGQLEALIQLGLVGDYATAVSKPA